MHDCAMRASSDLKGGRFLQVLQTGEELSEMQAAQVDFVVDRPTLLAANLLSWARTVQASGPPVPSLQCRQYPVDCGGGNLCIS